VSAVLYFEALQSADLTAPVLVQRALRAAAHLAAATKLKHRFPKSVKEMYLVHVALFIFILSDLGNEDD
jgi:hypothetical protein